MKLPRFTAIIFGAAAFSCLFIASACGQAPAATDALAAVNAQRAQRGLKPYIYDANLTAAAIVCAEFRAARRIHGHTSNDFNALPRGVTARAAGCAALPLHFGWGACATFDTKYSRCGAAWVIGPDGRRYCHAFYVKGVLHESCMLLFAGAC